MSKTYVIIPDFDDWKHTKKCIEALRASNQCEIHIVVVDHGTKKETKQVLENKYSNIECIEGNQDLWWAGATNLGIRYALRHGAELIVLLNNDCYVEADTISSLVSYSVINPNAIIAPLQLNISTDRIVEKARTCFLLGFPTLMFSKSHSNWKRGQGLHKTGLIMGGRCALIPATVFQKIGLLDESNLPHYGADHDFYLRCRKYRIPLYINHDTCVLIDDTKTSMATRLRELTFSEFINTLKNRRSHRNISDLRTLFKRYYPIKHLYFIGVVLNISRYFMLYIWQRLGFYLSRVF